MSLRFGIAVLAAISLRPAFGLDPSRTLTQYAHRVWQAQQGLPEGTIYSIAQTHDGYLWLGTQTGLIRFDGVRFETATAPSNVWIRSAIEDSKHALWVATNDAGLYRIEGESVSHYSSRDGLPSDSIVCLATTKNGDIWACTPNGVARIRAGKLTTFATEQGIGNNNARAVCEAGDGTLWVADEEHLNAWDGSRFVSHRPAKLPPGASIRALQCSGDTLWAGTTAGLLEITKSGERLITQKDGLADNRVLCLTAGREDSLWIGTRNGFSRLRKGEIESYRPEEGLSQSTVFSMFEDVEGSLWVGTKNGLNQFFSGRVLPYTMNEGLPSNDTGPIVQDPRGDIWIGTLGAGLARFNGKRFDVMTTKQGLASNTIATLAQDGDHTLFVGTTAGIDRVSLDRSHDDRIAEHYSTAQGLPSANVRALFVSRNEASLWVGTEKGPAVYITGSRFAVPANIPAELHGAIAAINEDDEGRIFLATEHDGLFVYENGAAHELLQNGASIRDVDALYSDSDGLMWIGTEGGGLRLLDHGKMTTFFVRDGMFDNEIYGIIRDDGDRLWMACSKGLFYVNRSDLLKFAAGTLKKVVSIPFSPTDALRTIECRSGVQPGSVRMQDGRLWFSTIRGLIVFDPKHLKLNAPPPPVVIEETTVNGERVDPQAIAAIAPGLKNLEFTYSGLTFLQPNRIRFRYILEGFDKNWTEAGTRREAFYTNLPPRKYRFRVTACNADNVCNETGASVSFALAPHFYQRAWFLPMCVLALCLAGWMIYQLRIHRLREQFNLILTERSRIARELHDTLIQGLSGITMEMQALAGRLRAPEERATLEDIVRDAGTCLRETRRSVAGLRSGGQGPESGLGPAIAQAAKHITEAKNVRLKLKLDKGPSELSPEVQYNLLRIASEAVNNSVKHSGAKTIEVTLTANADELQLSVKDDGSGISRENGGVRPGHYGLIGMKERAAQIGAELSLASEPGRGTTVSVLLPISLLTAKHAVGVHIL
jgi:ligand-binding sensor domain-containing protein/anti-sigma regulatory factor (Ser/Thr protein kinase)